MNIRKHTTLAVATLAVSLLLPMYAQAQIPAKVGQAFRRVFLRKHITATVQQAVVKNQLNPSLFTVLADKDVKTMQQLCREIETNPQFFRELYRVNAEGRTALEEAWYQYKDISRRENLTKEEDTYKQVITLLQETQQKVRASSQFKVALADQYLLHKAIYNKEIDKVLSMMEQGADLNIRLDWEGTAMHTIADRGVTDLVQPAIEHGAFLSSQDDYGQTPLMRALYNPETLQRMCDEIVANPVLVRELYRTDKAGRNILDIVRQQYNLHTDNLEKHFIHEQSLKILENTLKRIEALKK